MSIPTAKHIIKVLTENYGKQYSKLAMEKIWPDLIKEPAKAMESACDFFILNSSFLPSPAQLLEKVQSEGKKISMAAATKREEDWNREKGVNNRGRVEGDTFLSKNQQKEYDQRSLMMLKAMINNGPSEMIAEGCLAMATAYSHVGDEWRKLRQDIIGMLPNSEK